MKGMITTKQKQMNTSTVVHIRGSWWITFWLEECCAGGAQWGVGGGGGEVGGGEQAPFLWDWPTASWQASPEQIQVDGNEEQEKEANKTSWEEEKKGEKKNLM